MAGFANNDDVTLTIETGASGSETSYYKIRIRKGAAGQVTLEENTSGVQSNTDHAKIVVTIHVGLTEIIEVNRVNTTYTGTDNAYAFDETTG